MKLVKEIEKSKGTNPLMDILIDHFNYSIADIKSYDELTPEEKKIIPENVFKRFTE